MSAAGSGKDARCLLETRDKISFIVIVKLKDISSSQMQMPTSNRSIAQLEERIVDIDEVQQFDPAYSYNI